MAALRAAKKALRSEVKRRVSALSPEEKRRQSQLLSHKVRTGTALGLGSEFLGSRLGSLYYVENVLRIYTEFYGHGFMLRLKTTRKLCN